MDVVVHYYNHRKTGQSRVWPSSLKLSGSLVPSLCYRYVHVRHIHALFPMCHKWNFRFDYIENMFDFSHEKHEGTRCYCSIDIVVSNRCYRGRLFVNARTVFTPTCDS